MCYVTVQNWTKPYDTRLMPVISTNSREMILHASGQSSCPLRPPHSGTFSTNLTRTYTVYWKPCAITAIIFMSIVSFVGWWYQRRMRDTFTTCMSLLYSLCRGRAKPAFSPVVKEIDQPGFETEYAKEARHTPIDGPSLVISSSERHVGSVSDASRGDTPQLGTPTAQGF